MRDKIARILKDSIEVKKRLVDSQSGNIEKACGVICDALGRGGKILIFGNGGSAADSQHMAAELVGRFKKERKALAAIALTANTSNITALANDYGYDIIFSRQLEALGAKGDVALGISTSGNSKNVIGAIKAAKAIGMKTIGLTGAGGGQMADICDLLIAVDSKDTPRIQESHVTIIHIICELVEERLFK